MCERSIFFTIYPNENKIKPSVPLNGMEYKETKPK